MGLTKSDQNMRRGRVGASEAPALLGLSPWKKPEQAIEDWVARHAPDFVAPTWPAADRGSRYERAIFDAYLDRCEDLPSGAIGGQPGKTTVHPSCDWLCATPDFVLVDRLVQVKFVDSASSRAKWKEGVPEYVAAQVLIEMACTSMSRCDVVADLGGTTLLGTSKWTLYRNVEAETEIIAQLERVYRTELEPRLREMENAK